MANVNVILDEAASLGSNMGCIEDALDKYRGYGIRLHLYYQSPSQLKKCFPNEQDQTVLANVTQVFFAVNDMSAEYISNRLGEETIVVESGGNSSGYSTPSGMGSNGQSTYSSNSTSNWSQMGRKLLKPEEILSLDERLAITFVAGQRPILTRLERYYEKQSKKRQLSGFDALVISFVICLIMTNCFLISLDHLKKAQHDGFVQRVEEFRSRSVSGTQSSGDSRVDGTRFRAVQRQRVRPLRTGPVYADAGN